MNTRIVLAFFNDDETAAALAKLRAKAAEVIAVVFDLGGGGSLNELRLAALAAGAARCHSLDVSEEFLRSAVLPALKAFSSATTPPPLGEIATRFVNDQLQAVARIEQATVIERREPISTGGSKRPALIAGPALLEIDFSDGVPVAVNEIPMALGELMESVETIAGVQAAEVIRLAYRELGQSGDGQVAIRTGSGQCELVAVAAAV